MKKIKSDEKHQIFEKPNGHYSTPTIEACLEEDKSLENLLSNKPLSQDYRAPNDVFMDLLNVNLLNIGKSSTQKELELEITDTDQTFINRIKVLCQHKPIMFTFIPTICNNILYFYDQNWFRLSLLYAVAIIINDSRASISELTTYKEGIFDLVNIYFQMAVSKTTLVVTKEKVDENTMHAFHEIGKACKLLEARVNNIVTEQEAELEKIDQTTLEGIKQKELGMEILNQFS